MKKGPFRVVERKAPAAICRKVAEAENESEIEIWGDGNQTRSFLHVSDCITGIFKLMESPGFHGPVNIGSDEMVTINDLAYKVHSHIKKTDQTKTHRRSLRSART